MSSLSEPARTRIRSRTARPRAAGLICVLALGISGAFVSTSFAQLPMLPDIPGLPDPDDPDETPPPSEDPQEPAPSPPAGPSKLDPFPVVVVAGRQGKRSTRVTELSVKGPHRARVQVRCLGSRCPVRRASATIPRAKRLRIKKAQRVYRAGLIIEIRVTGTDRVGKYTKIRIRSGRIPGRSDACLQPGSRTPSPCP